MTDVFLSYSREDQATARRFAAALQQEGFAVWWDQSLTAGEAFDEVTERALHEARAVVVLWSAHSVASRWVRAEAAQADDNGTLVPVLIEPCNLPIKFKLTQAATLSHWHGDHADHAWQSFVAGLRRFIGRGQEPAQAQAQVSSPPPAGPTDSRPRTSGSRRLGLAIAAAALLAVTTGWLLLRDRSAPTDAPVTLAVLPFADLSEARDQENFSDGLTEEILNELTQVAALRVTGRTSSFSFKGKNEDLRNIARQLGVANLLEGSIRREGELLRITVQLIDGRDGAQLFSRPYDGKRSDVFRLQKAIARDVAQALQVRLDAGSLRQAEGGTTDVEAYEKYLEGKELLGSLTRSSLDLATANRAVAVLREAVGQDPQYSRAWASLASAAGAAASLSRRDPETDPEALDAHRRAREITPDAWWVGLVELRRLREERRWADFDRLSARMLAERPLTAADLERSAPRGEFLMQTGRVNEMLALAQQAGTIDPLVVTLALATQEAAAAAGRRDIAEQEFVHVMALSEVWQVHAAALMTRLGALMSNPQPDTAEIRSTIARLLKLQEFNPEWKTLLQALDRAGEDRAAARAAVQAASKTPFMQNGAALSRLATFAGALGDTELAIESLRKSLIEYRSTNVSAIWAPFAADVRRDARFKTLVHELGLVDYWRSSSNWGDFCKAVGSDDFECH